MTGGEPSRQEQDAFVGALDAAVDVLDQAEIPYAVIGGLAASGFGRPRRTHDIDLFVRPSDARRTLEVLSRNGFRTEETDVTWLFKAFRDDVLVDIIFRSKGDFYFDEEMMERSVRRLIGGREVRFVSPEDLLALKATVHDEASPHHWHDALGVIAATELDWDYFLHRARRAPRRLLSLLLYAHSVDLPVPNRVVRALFDRIYNS